jgi:hypothetical protein
MLNEGQSKGNKEKNSLPLDQTNASELVHFPKLLSQHAVKTVHSSLSNFESIQVLAQPKERDVPTRAPMFHTPLSIWKESD